MSDIEATTSSGGDENLVHRMLSEETIKTAATIDKLVADKNVKESKLKQWKTECQVELDSAVQLLLKTDAYKGWTEAQVKEAMHHPKAGTDWMPDAALCLSYSLNYDPGLFSRSKKGAYSMYSTANVFQTECLQMGGKSGRVALDVMGVFARNQQADFDKDMAKVGKVIDLVSSLVPSGESAGNGLAYLYGVGSEMATGAAGEAAAKAATKIDKVVGPLMGGSSQSGSGEKSKKSKSPTSSGDVDKGDYGAIWSYLTNNYDAINPVNAARVKTQMGMASTSTAAKTSNSDSNAPREKFVRRNVNETQGHYQARLLRMREQGLLKKD